MKRFIESFLIQNGSVERFMHDLQHNHRITMTFNRHNKKISLSYKNINHISYK